MIEDNEQTKDKEIEIPIEEGGAKIEMGHFHKGGPDDQPRIDHRDLTFKDADDHPQYVKADGTRAYTGTGDGFKDEDDMASNSPTAAASQQSIKAYVDNAIGSLDLNPSLAVVSDNLQLSDDDAEESDVESWTEKKALTIENGGYVRVKFDMRRTTNPYGTQKGRIYINDVAVGTIQETTSENWTTYAEDFEVEENDEIELYVLAASPGRVEVRNFRIYFDKNTKKYVDDEDDAGKTYTDQQVQKAVKLTPSDNLQASAVNVRNGTNSGYHKEKEIEVKHWGKIRVKFDIKSEAGGTAYGRIYVNGVAVGTERTTTETTYQTYSEDIAVEHGDLVQLYMKIIGGGGENWYARNFRLYWDKTLEDADYSINLN